LSNALAARGLVGDVTPAEFAASAGHFLWMTSLYVIVWGLPNTQQIMRRFSPALGRIQPGPFGQIAWRPSRNWAVVIGVAACVGVLAIGGSSEFLYFQF
jgi:alginate O-acetyltransferase complex protein AlgI